MSYVALLISVDDECIAGFHNMLTCTYALLISVDDECIAGFHNMLTCTYSQLMSYRGSELYIYS
jgi:hypothetical protein